MCRCSKVSLTLSLVKLASSFEVNFNNKLAGREHNQFIGNELRHSFVKVVPVTILSVIFIDGSFFWGTVYIDRSIISSKYVVPFLRYYKFRDSSHLIFYFCSYFRISRICVCCCEYFFVIFSTKYEG